MTLMNRLPRPCLDCHVLQTNGARCVVHARARKNRMYNGSWPAIRKATIEANPQCVDCGHTGSPSNPLTGDHVEAGSLRAGVVTRCRSCNSAKGSR